MSSALTSGSTPADVHEHSPLGPGPGRPARPGSGRSTTRPSSAEGAGLRDDRPESGPGQGVPRLRPERPALRGVDAGRHNRHAAGRGARSALVRHRPRCGTRQRPPDSHRSPLQRLHDDTQDGSTTTPKTAKGTRTIALDPATAAALRTHRTAQEAERLAWRAAHDNAALAGDHHVVDERRPRGERRHRHLVAGGGVVHERLAVLPPATNRRRPACSTANGRPPGPSGASGPPRPRRSAGHPGTPRRSGSSRRRTSFPSRRRCPRAGCRWEGRITSGKGRPAPGAAPPRGGGEGEHGGGDGGEAAHRSSSVGGSPEDAPFGPGTTRAAAA